jgi:hypothetical protein
LASLLRGHPCDFSFLFKSENRIDLPPRHMRLAECPAIARVTLGVRVKAAAFSTS